MNDREKLIELIVEARDKDFANCDDHAICEGCAYENIRECHSACIADHLIANGVTFATGNNVPNKWIPVTERLPEENGTYIVSAFDGHDGRTSFAKWQNRFKTWYLTGARSYWKVTHWMPLPAPPEGD